MAFFIILVAGVVELAAWALGGGLETGVIALVASSLFAVFSYYASSSIVLSISHAVEVKHDENPDLYHIVENLCIGAGIPVPKIYIIDDTAPNAFATGRDPQRAVVVVTKGLLQKLGKLELEGVIAHELSHIRNYDIRIMTVTVVLIGLVALVADVALRLSFFGAGRRRSSSDRGAGAAIMMVIAIVALILAPIAAELIRMAISRKREYLADASGALLTRYPEGLARALEKISGDHEPLEAANKATAHLYIVNPLKDKKSGVNNLFSTHPPLEERIRRLRSM
jgi:heat shock protein HtpX